MTEKFKLRHCQTPVFLDGGIGEGISGGADLIGAFSAVAAGGCMEPVTGLDKPNPPPSVKPTII